MVEPTRTLKYPALFFLLACGAHCTTCSTAGVCTACTAGYKLESNICERKSIRPLFSILFIYTLLPIRVRINAQICIFSPQIYICSPKFSDRTTFFKHYWVPGPHFLKFQARALWIVLRKHWYIFAFYMTSFHLHIHITELNSRSYIMYLLSMLLMQGTRVLI